MGNTDRPDIILCGMLKLAGTKIRRDSIKVNPISLVFLKFIVDILNPGIQKSRFFFFIHYL
jgi:hypothetical protein